MAKTIRLDIITPERLFYRGEIELVIARTLSGDEGFMANHTWACKLLATGELWIQEAGSKDFRIAAITGGFIDIKEKFTIFTDAAEWPDEIDVERAMKSELRAKEWLQEHSRDVLNAELMSEAKRDILKSHTRVNVAGGGARRKK
ncbi:MAG: F0F1 ATP synthase subunit epsilon [Clostridiales Family XIII bacterium]|jgi:F-type H+-transporting ATPase subunit epsilon|nr:F0F1 ATP synthase subunit epsilon [Clostridiales Family XIII bacterium]